MLKQLCALERSLPHALVRRGRGAEETCGRERRTGEIERFIALIEGSVAYSLYKAVSEAKTRLSRDESARLMFAAAGVELNAQIARVDFERWIARDLAHISVSIDDALAKAGLAADAIDRVFLTGGTSFVPAVRRLFTQRFGAEKVDSGDEFVSIANGLALIGEKEDIARWTVDESVPSTVAAKLARPSIRRLVLQLDMAVADERDDDGALDLRRQVGGRALEIGLAHHLAQQILRVWIGEHGIDHRVGDFGQFGLLRLRLLALLAKELAGVVSLFGERGFVKRLIA
ncbi:Hsp70 family protein [Rhodomicrobium sp.]|uniref:Hsp70 family protein n=1 Tax=Rhodomicrobium sp. TaxID=2720632 RepID=UPI0039E588D2